MRVLQGPIRVDTSFSSRRLEALRWIDWEIEAQALASQLRWVDWRLGARVLVSIARKAPKDAAVALQGFGLFGLAGLVGVSISQVPPVVAVGGGGGIAYHPLPPPTMGDLSEVMRYGVFELGKVGSLLRGL